MDKKSCCGVAAAAFYSVEEPIKRAKRLGSPLGGKRSAVAVVNDSPVGCQSRDRAARRRLSRVSVTERVIEYLQSKYSIFPDFHRKSGDPLRPRCARPPLPEGEASDFCHTRYFPTTGIRASRAARAAEMVKTTTDTTGTAMIGSKASTWKPQRCSTSVTRAWSR